MTGLVFVESRPLLGAYVAVAGAVIRGAFDVTDDSQS